MLNFLSNLSKIWAKFCKKNKFEKEFRKKKCMKKNSNNISSLKLCTFWHITEFSMKRNWIFPSINCFSKLLLNHDLQKRKLRLLTIGWEMQWSCNYMYWLYIYIYMLQVDILWDLYSRSVGTEARPWEL